jgi:hypothetical protein
MSSLVGRMLGCRDLLASIFIRYMKATFGVVCHTLTFILLIWRIGRALNSIPIYVYIQQDAKLNSLFVSGNCSTCFGWYFHPSSGAHTTVSTTSGICAVGGVRHPQHTQTGSNSSTIASDSINGVTNTRCCRYSCMRS